MKPQEIHLKWIVNQEGEKVSCKDLKCECDQTMCPALETCSDPCFTERYESIECGCQVLAECVRDINNPECIHQGCVDHDGCARDLGERWYHNEDACNSCVCLENGLVSCNDRSALCMDMPSCPGGELLVAYSCDQCCLNYECIEDKCYNKCETIHQPCCQAHEKVIRVERDAGD